MTDLAARAALFLALAPRERERLVGDLLAELEGVRAERDAYRAALEELSRATRIGPGVVEPFYGVRAYAVARRALG
jgi:hypothetical protein